jgi:ectoine hydroxylase-related dioxygenase (phytanoyl-CoA dioxygenase family)
MKNTATKALPTHFSLEEKQEMKRQFIEYGYVMQRVLSDDEITSLRKNYEQVLSTSKNAAVSEKHGSSLQHLGDNLADFGSRAKHYYFHILTSKGTEALHSAYYHSKIIEIVEFLLGENLIINNASMLAANPGTYYNLGWHRDVIQIPENEIRDELFSKERQHNSCQINLPLYDEDFLQVIPASHNRPNTSGENEAFAGTKHYAPLNANMPGAQKVFIDAGSALFYNNNLIHRGYCEKIENPRRTLHMGFHSATRKPTWHFYLLSPNNVKEEDLQRLDPTLKNMMSDYLDCYKKHPDMSATWQAGWDGNP